MRKYDKLLQSNRGWHRDKILLRLRPSTIYKIEVQSSRAMGYRSATILAIPRVYNNGSVYMEILGYEGEPRSGIHKSISYFAMTPDGITEVPLDQLPLYMSWNLTEAGKAFLSQTRTLRRAA